MMRPLTWKTVNRVCRNIRRYLSLPLTIVLLSYGISTSSVDAQDSENPQPTLDGSSGQRSGLEELLEPEMIETTESKATTDEQKSGKGDSTSPHSSIIRDLLNNNLDLSRGGSIPVLATEAVTVGMTSGSAVKIELPDEASLIPGGARRGSSEVIYNSRKELQVEVAAIDGNGIRFIIVIEGPNAPTTYTYPLSLPESIRLKIKKGAGNALLVKIDEDGNELPVGYIDIPWAIDAEGKDIPVSQIITKTKITLTINHRNAVYPVYADPTYYNINCSIAYGKNISPVSRYIYENGICPFLSFYDSKGYWPVGTTYMGPHRTVEQHGECSKYPDTFWAHDHQVPCKAHDYCYDLAREQYTYATKKSCDNIFQDDLYISCRTYSWWDVRRYACLSDIPGIMAIVRTWGNL